jgi:hypothetical protein
MPPNQEREDPPADFVNAVESLRRVRLRPEVQLDEAPAPQRLAPFAVAVTAEVVIDDDELGNGRFVVLHDPAGHETWNGVFRIVTFVRAPLEIELASDPMVPAVGWSWLNESLTSREAPYTAASGTVTRVASESFGAMSDRPSTAEIEVRASWTALDPDLGPHLEAWGDLLCTAAGLAPLAPGVVALPRPRRT